MSSYRRMLDRDFRDRQHARLHKPHIEPFTDLVRQLTEEADRGPMPYIVPLYGGVDARVLSLLGSPGPSTKAHTGSGMLCVENNDATAERMADLLAQARIPVAALLPWNAYPWYIPELRTGHQRPRSRGAGRRSRAVAAPARARTPDRCCRAARGRCAERLA